VIWIPKGSGSNGIGSNWEHDNQDERLNSNADVDAIIFDGADNSSNYTAPAGDDFTNFEEYRGIVYALRNDVGVLELRHLRLNPHRKDLFIRGEGFDDAAGDIYREFDPVDGDWSNYYPFRIGRALYWAGIDVWNTTGWHHDATENNDFFVHHKTGQIESVVDFEVNGSGTNWLPSWPGYEMEFRIGDTDDNPWVPVSAWSGPQRMFLMYRYPIQGTGPWTYSVRMPLPHINVLTVRLDKETDAAFSSEDGHIRFLLARKPSPQNPLGSRHWAWSTKGLSIASSDSEVYGIAVPLQKPLDSYFDDTPYKKRSIWENGSWRSPDLNDSNDLKLAPLAFSEDPEDTGEYIDGYMDDTVPVLLGNTPNSQWDGDQRLIDKSLWTAEGHLNPFDIDANGYVELPPAKDPSTGVDNFNNQHDAQDRPYTKARVLMHTITHEMIHVLAGPWHSKVPECVMYQYSTDWKRDDYLSNGYRELLRIHNQIRY
jgi:hypothetical protein